MATRKKPPVDDDAQSVIPLDLTDLYTAESLTPALASLYAEMGIGEDGESTVHVGKLDPSGRGVEMGVWRGAPDEYDLEAIARTHGSGQYRVKVYVRIPEGQKVCKGNKIFGWQLTPAEEAARHTAQAPAATAPAATLDAQSIAAAVAQALGGILAPLLTSQQPNQSRADMLKEMQMMGEIFRGTMPQQSQAVNPLDMMKQVLDITNTVREAAAPLDAGANATGNDLMLAVINKFGPMFAGALQQSGAANMGQNLQAAQLAAPAPGQPDQQPPAAHMTTGGEAQPEGEDIMLKIKMGLSFLCTQAKADNDPTTYADMLMDNVPGPELKALLEAPDWMAKLSAFHKDVATYEPWFAELRTITLEAMGNPPPGAPDPLAGNAPVDNAEVKA